MAPVATAATKTTSTPKKQNQAPLAKETLAALTQQSPGPGRARSSAGSVGRVSLAPSSRPAAHGNPAQAAQAAPASASGEVANWLRWCEETLENWKSGAPEMKSREASKWIKETQSSLAIAHSMSDKHPQLNDQCKQLDAILSFWAKWWKPKALLIDIMSRWDQMVALHAPPAALSLQVICRNFEMTFNEGGFDDVKDLPFLDTPMGKHGAACIDDAGTRERCSRDLMIKVMEAACPRAWQAGDYAGQSQTAMTRLQALLALPGELPPSVKGHMDTIKSLVHHNSVSPDALGDAVSRAQHAQTHPAGQNHNSVLCSFARSRVGKTIIKEALAAAAHVAKNTVKQEELTDVAEKINDFSKTSIDDDDGNADVAINLANQLHSACTGMSEAVYSDVKEQVEI